MIDLNTSDLSQLKTLRAGDIVSISGTVYTARDAAHKKLYAMLETGEKLPFDLNGAFIYYTGATPVKNGEVIGSCGPTTSKRMDKYTPLMLDNGLAAVIGKGARSKAVTEAFAKQGAVYFVAIGGAGAFYKAAVLSAQLISFPELLSEAVYKLEVKDFRCVVAIDTDGKCIYD